MSFVALLTCLVVCSRSLPWVVGCCLPLSAPPCVRHCVSICQNGEVDTAPQRPGQAMATQSINALRTFSTAAALLAPFAVASSAFADTAVATPAADAPPKVELGPAPTDFGLKLTDYYDDCQKVVNHIRYAVQLEKGNPIIADFAGKTKEEMNDFVSFYRRFSGIQGRQSFSLLYTSINVLAGHYTSYGLKFPVPEKRRKRLLQELVDIEKNIRKKR